MKVAVDRSMCVGHAQCSAICPSVFSNDDLGYAVVAGDGTVAAGGRGGRRSGRRLLPGAGDLDRRRLTRRAPIGAPACQVARPCAKWRGVAKWRGLRIDQPSRRAITLAYAMWPKKAPASERRRASAFRAAASSGFARPASTSRSAPRSISARKYGRAVGAST